VSRPAGWLENAQSVTQTVQVADAGYGYAVIGGDMEVFQGRWPAYVLGEYQTEPKADVSSLLAQPSRMLDARSAVVDFTGREAELAELRRWRDASGPALAARWLYAPGGQGKTRLALEFASRCALAGFKVVTVTQGSVVKPSPGVQDLRLRGARGLLVLVDYADRWPVSHLSWLFSNALFGHADVPTRLLLLARSAQPWPAIRAVLGDLRSDTSEQRLSSLPGGAGLDDRERMFATARDCFAACHGITQTAGIPPPGPLSGPEFGLTLTLHMAALTAVDAHVNGLRPPQGAAGLSAYLLDRERSHWTRLYENRVEGLQYRTPPDVMARAVFTAVLTGAAPHQRGSEILGRLGLEIHPDRVLADHAACYPPSDPGTVLEPLYPDRLAEDFLALALPGHSVVGYEPWPWAPATAGILADPDGDGSPPPYAARMITFLAAAASSGHWPHVVGTLAKILEANPAAAVTAGGPVLAALAEVTDLDPETLARVEPYLPDRPHADLDLGIATLVQRLADRRLATATDPAERAAIHTALATRYANAGMHSQAATAAEAAVGIARELAEAEPGAHQPGLASGLDVLGRARTDSGDFQQGLALLEEAVAIRRRLAEADPAAQ
jgi:hypothetical protein